MDLLQMALIFLIFLLSIFLTITGFQVFFILRDLKKALDRLNEGNLPSYGSKVLQTGEETQTEIEKPQTASNLMTALSLKAKARIKPRRFYKKTL